MAGAGLVAGAVTAFGAVSLPAALSYVFAGGAALWIWNSFQERGPVGPTQYATRYRMEQWEDDEESEEVQVEVEPPEASDD